jgi:hypothetical protein
MLYLVEGHPTIEVGDRVDAGEGPGPTFTKITERFRPQAFYGNPTRRQVFYDRRAQYAGGDRGVDVRAELVVEDRTELHSAHATRDLRRGNRERKEDCLAATLSATKRRHPTTAGGGNRGPRRREARPHPHPHH